MALFGGQNGLMRPGIAAAEPQNVLAPRPTAADAYDTNAQAVERWLTEQQQISADRGLWQGGSVLEGGGPTGAGWVDAAGQTANALMMGTTAPGRPGFTAYHGSPHDFPPTPRNPHGEFDATKIGTGEGAQAYGVGAAYLAEREGTAKGYRDQLAGRGGVFEWNGQPVPPGQPAFELVDNLANQDWRLGKIAEQAAKYGPRSAIETFEPHTRNKSDGAEWQSAMEQFKQGAGKSVTGHMYEVQVNADPEHFLHWDKPLSEQSPHVQDAFKKLGYEGGTDAAGRPLTGSEIYKAFGDPASASQFLKDSGISGIRYLDAGSRDAGAGSHNYVVFDAATLEILRKYGLAGLMLGGGAAAGAQGSGE